MCCLVHCWVLSLLVLVACLAFVSARYVLPQDLKPMMFCCCVSRAAPRHVASRGYGLKRY